MTAGRSFNEWAAVYQQFDLPSLLAEAATLDKTEPFDRLAAMFVQLLEAIGNTEMRDVVRVRAVRLAMATQQDLEEATAANQAARERLDLGREAIFDRLLRSAKYPEFVKLLRPDGERH
jgi:hypothetical protein